RHRVESLSSAKLARANSYGLTVGQGPFPGFHRTQNNSAANVPRAKMASNEQLDEGISLRAKPLTLLRATKRFFPTPSAPMRFSVLHRGGKMPALSGGLKMPLSNLSFAFVFLAAIAGCLTVMAIVWWRRPKEDN